MLNIVDRCVRLNSQPIHVNDISAGTKPLPKQTYLWPIKV